MSKVIVIAGASWKATDVTRRDEVEALVHWAEHNFRQVDGVVNNAGMMPLSNLDRRQGTDKQVPHGLLSPDGHQCSIKTVASRAAHRSPDDLTGRAPRGSCRDSDSSARRDHLSGSKLSGAGNR
jgi:NAD(P)-dependent dehydrogenase (short-subunit alcohol dehydrogenase family)